MYRIAGRGILLTTTLRVRGGEPAGKLYLPNKMPP